MKIQSLKTKLIGPVLPLIPMACMHLGDDHHSGDHHSSTHQQSLPSSTLSLGTGGMMMQGGMITHQESTDSK